ncbi:MAG: alkaline phosphatase family protein, partial [Chitinophagaceae bacterium]
MKLTIKFSLAALCAVALFSCHNSNSGNNNSSQTEEAAAVKLPKPDHIIVVIDENKGYDQIIGASQAPYINQLAKEGALFTDSHGVQHPSQPNYLAFFSGSTQGVKGDECLQDST